MKESVYRCNICSELKEKDEIREVRTQGLPDNDPFQNVHVCDTCQPAFIKSAKAIGFDAQVLGTRSFSSPMQWITLWSNKWKERSMCQKS